MRDYLSLWKFGFRWYRNFLVSKEDANGHYDICSLCCVNVLFFPSLSLFGQTKQETDGIRKWLKEAIDRKNWMKINEIFNVTSACKLCVVRYANVSLFPSDSTCLVFSWLLRYDLKNCKHILCSTTMFEFICQPQNATKCH